MSPLEIVTDGGDKVLFRLIPVDATQEDVDMLEAALTSHYGDMDVRAEQPPSS